MGHIYEELADRYAKAWEATGGHMAIEVRVTPEDDCVVTVATFLIEIHARAPWAAQRWSVAWKITQELNVFRGPSPGLTISIIHRLIPALEELEVWAWRTRAEVAEHRWRCAEIELRQLTGRP